jgi:hypothetical protein
LARPDGALAIGELPWSDISAIATLGWVARAKAIACKGYYGEAKEWLAANRAPERAQRIFKAAIGAGSTADARIDVRWGTVDADNSRRYAAELVALAPNVILASACFWPNPHLWQSFYGFSFSL